MDLMEKSTEIFSFSTGLKLCCCSNRGILTVVEMSGTLVAAHRGYKAKYAENTLAAFEGAMEAGVDMIETDVQVTSDGIVVINHDPFTGRNYNRNLIIADTKLEELKSLTNKADSKQKIVTFEELVKWSLEQTRPVQLMLDIKVSNNVTVLAKIVGALLNVNSDLSFWYDKVIFGLWNLHFYKFAVEANLLANFRIINITVSPTIAKQFLEFSSTLPKKFRLFAISLLHLPLIAREFKHIHEDMIKPQGIKLFLWTSNKEEQFQQALDWGAYGVITDYPEDALTFFKKSHTLPGSEATSLVKKHYQQPSIFTVKGLKLNLRFMLFRVFEFLMLNGFLIHRPVQLLVFKFIRLVVADQ